MLDVKKVLDDAADLLIDKGWIQGQSRSPRGFCAMGAIQEVCNGDRSAASQASAQLAGVINGNIATWNDLKGRKMDEVVDKLREAAQSLR